MARIILRLLWGNIANTYFQTGADMKKQNFKKYILGTSIVVVFNFGGTVVADVKNFGSEIPDEAEIVEALKPKVTNNPKFKLKIRGIHPVEPKESNLSEQVQSEVIAATQLEKPAASFGLTFNFNSSVLTEAAKTRLDKIGGALKSKELSTSVFLVEGHTDSLGSEKYNDWLSEERADSARKYLVQKFAIDASRLQIIGKGESDPLNKNNPKSAENRRVLIVNLGSE